MCTRSTIITVSLPECDETIEINRCISVFLNIHNNHLNVSQRLCLNTISYFSLKRFRYQKGYFFKVKQAATNAIHELRIFCILKHIRDKAQR